MASGAGVASVASVASVAGVASVASVASVAGVASVAIVETVFPSCWGLMVYGYDGTHTKLLMNLLESSFSRKLT